METEYQTIPCPDEDPNCGILHQVSVNKAETEKEPMNNPQMAIDQIMDSFDFAQVYRCMKLLNWKWSIENETPNRVPFEAEIRSHARQLLKMCISDFQLNPENTGVSAGGFYACLYPAKDEGTNSTLELAFTLESQEVNL